MEHRDKFVHFQFPEMVWTLGLIWKQYGINVSNDKVNLQSCLKLLSYGKNWGLTVSEIDNVKSSIYIADNRNLLNSEAFEIGLKIFQAKTFSEKQILVQQLVKEDF